MNIKNKMIGSYVCIALLSLAIVFFSVKLMHTTEDRYVRLTNETIPMIESIQELRFATLRLVAATTEAAFIDRVSVFIDTDETLPSEKVLTQLAIKKYDSALANYAEYIKIIPG